MVREQKVPSCNGYVKKWSVMEDAVTNSHPWDAEWTVLIQNHLYDEAKRNPFGVPKFDGFDEKCELKAFSPCMQLLQNIVKAQKVKNVVPGFLKTWVAHDEPPKYEETEVPKNARFT